MGNDLSIKPRENEDKENLDKQKFDKTITNNKNPENNDLNVNNIQQRFKSQYLQPSTNPIYIEKRKRFRELVSLQLNKRKPLNLEILKVFKDYKPELSEKNPKNDNTSSLLSKQQLDSNEKSDLLDNYNTLDTLNRNTFENNTLSSEFDGEDRNKNDNDNNNDDDNENDEDNSIRLKKGKSKTKDFSTLKISNYNSAKKMNTYKGRSKLFDENTIRINNNINKSEQKKYLSKEKTKILKSSNEKRLLVSSRSRVGNYQGLSDYSKLKKKNQENLRNKFYTSLIANNCWGKDKLEQTCQNIFIFDWDDTIMCTTYITPTGYFTEKHLKELELKKDQEVFKHLEELIIKVLSFAVEQADTYIITNAASGWVEYSTRMFFPSVLPLLNRITIISARGWFEKEFPRNSKMWKLSCFEEIGKIQNKNKTTNLVVVGDSLIEMEAAYILARHIEKCYVKTIKLKDAPSPTQIVKQLNLLCSDLHKIVKIHASMAISVQKHKKKTESLSKSTRITPHVSIKSRNLMNRSTKKIVTRDLQRFSAV